MRPVTLCNWIRTWLSLLLVALAAPVLAETVDDVLLLKKTPVGVVFEIISNDEDHLRQAIPEVQADIARLRKRFPDLDIAIVSHGTEQFALTTENQEEYPETHERVQSLVADKNTSFHVCGTFASMKNVMEEDFPEYVDVAAHGPMQIKTYEDFGYLKILVD